MIDIHVHILPELDDGAPDMEAALTMAELAVRSGVTAMIATPHSNMPDYFENYYGEGLYEAFTSFRSAIRRAGIELQVYLGMEIFGTPQTAQLLRQGRLTTLAESGYPLIEFPFRNYEQEATQILRQVAAMGYRPVVAHPERYAYVQDNPAIVNEWLKMGCLLQLNRGSLQGHFGRAPQVMAYSLVERGFASFVASDAHSALQRTTWMLDAYTLLQEEFGEDTARLLLEDNPRRILLNRVIFMREPEWF